MSHRNDHDERDARVAALDRTPVEGLPLAGDRISPNLTRFLHARNIRTLDELRASGPIADTAAGLGQPRDREQLRELEAHGRLSLLGTDLSTNATLIARGYDDVTAIAARSREEFLRDLAPVLNEADASAIHGLARVQSDLVVNALAERWVESGMTVSSDTDPLVGLWSVTCDCGTCRSALGPIAYLTDLLDYAVRHLRRAGAPITLGFLETQFCQPFSTLPATCSAASDPVRQIRIACEVLRRYQSTRGGFATPLTYLQAAYIGLLVRMGTSLDEIRSARTAKAEDRALLAERLSVTIDQAAGRPDRLDLLFQDPNDATALTEAWIEGVFGLRDTARDPVTATPTPELLVWRREWLRRQWAAQDWPTPPVSDALPLVDPDLVGPGDFVDPSPTLLRPRMARRPMDFWEDRRDWIQSLIQRYDATRQDPQGGLDSLLRDRSRPTPGSPAGTPLALGTPGISAQDVVTVDQQRDAGIDVSARLDTLGLTGTELAQLAAVARVDLAGQPVLADEWASVYSVLAQRAKRQQFPSWRQQEQAQGLTLTPDDFQLRDPALLAPVFPWHATSFRSTEEVRARWVETLRARIDEDKAAADAIGQAVAEVEALTLKDLREALIFATALPAPPNLQTRSRLTRRLQIDMEAGTCQMTTRIAQATETIQGALFGARNGLLEDPTVTLSADDFDAEWPWIGSVSTWKAAMQVFLYPENTLQPALRRRSTEAFRQLLTALRNGSPLRQEAVAAAVNTYAAYSNDMATLERAGVVRTEGPMGDAEAQPDVLAIATAGASGRLYASSWKLLPGYGFRGSPEQTFWERIGAADSAEGLMGFVPFAGGGDVTNVGVYSRGRRGGVETYFAGIFDGRTVRDPIALDVAPLLVCSQGSSITISPSAAFAAGGGGAWSVRSDDQIVSIDIDQDGRDELLLLGAEVAANGTRRTALARVRDGQLFIDWSGSLALSAGWRIPDPQYPVRLATGVLVTDSGATDRIGVLAWVNGSIALVGASTTVTGPGGTWTVDLGTVGSETVFLTASIDGTGPKVIALQQLPGTGARAYQERTQLIVMNRAGNQMTVVKITELMDSGGTIRADRPRAVLSRFGPQGSVSEPREDILVLLTHTDQMSTTNPVTNTVETRNVNRYFYKLLRWNDTAGSFSNPYPPGAEVLKRPAPDTTKWAVQRDDRFITMRRVGFRDVDRVLVFSPARRSVAILALTSGGELDLVEVHEVRVAGPDPMSEGWNIDADDILVTADFGPGSDFQLVVVSPVVGALFVAALDAGDKLVIRRPGLTTALPLPGAAAAAGCKIASVRQVTVGDVDNDGLDECIFFSNFGYEGALAVATVLKPTVPVAASIPAQYGPSGVAGLSPMTPPDAAAQRQAYSVNSMGGYEQNLVYLDEAWCFVPLAVALSLSASGEFESALTWFRRVYDDTRAPANRIVAAKLEAATSLDLTRALGWLADPLDPHRIADTRRDAYRRFAILALVGSILDWADTEFTRATTETISRARSLYLVALALLDDVDGPGRSSCGDLIGSLDITVGEDEVVWGLHTIKQRISAISSASALAQTVERIRTIVTSDAPWAERYAEAEAVAVVAVAEQKVRTIGETLSDEQRTRLRASRVAGASLNIRSTLDDLRRVPFPGAGSNPPGALVSESFAMSKNELADAAVRMFGRGARYIPAPKFQFCVPPNPAVSALRARAATNLRKLRSCRGIAGFFASRSDVMVAVTETSDGAARLAVQGVAPRLPVPYRYGVLIDRARQLTDLARQMESSLLAALEGLDRRRYERLKAGQDLELARAAVRLKDLHMKLANDGIATARLQSERARIQRDHYRTLLSRGRSENESYALAFSMAASALGGAGSASSGSSAGGGMAGMAAGMGMGAQLSSAFASDERRSQEWYLNRQLGDQDMLIGGQQVTSALDQAAIAADELAIGSVQLDQAETILDFLTTKASASEALFEWMSATLQPIYRFFLQQAASVAKLAEDALAFERQQPVPVFIQTDYWVPQEGPAPTAIGDSPIATMGMTGSARLLQDIYRLDQLAFLTDQRKLQLTETLSLAQVDPVAFQLFRITGVLPFSTPARLFDARFPGHYLRLIRGVRVSIVALVPPVEGVRATLSTTGSSRVVVGPPFETVVLNRGPETVALSAPMNATGLFEMDVQPQFLRPFEANGVDTTWQLELPRAANRFDFDTIADVLITIEYTALHSDEYQRQVVTRLPQRTTADRVFSFRHHLPDAWYDLHNPDNVEPPGLRVSFETRRTDYPPNLDRLSIRHLVLYFSQRNGTEASLSLAEMAFTPRGGPRFSSPSAGGPPQPTSRDGRLSTRTGAWNFVNAASTLFGGSVPVEGTWELTLPDSMRGRFERDEIADILLLVTYDGTRPDWP